MSNGGGGESSRGIEHGYLGRKKKPRKDEFAQSIAKIAVAQVCEGVGFQGFQQPALDTISDVACRYIRDIGKTANFYANLANRTECNVFDIIQGLEDLGLSQGFVGASDIDHCPTGSGVIREISQYVCVAEEIAFAFSVPSFPVVKERETTPSFVQTGETPPSEDIPRWLPRFPDHETYTELPSASIKEAEMKLDRGEQESKTAEPAALKLEQRLTCNGSELPMVVEPGDIAGRERPLVNNPFLAVPLQPGEKEVSSVFVPAKLLEEDVQNCRFGVNHVSALETFAPEIEAIKSRVCDTEEGSRRVLSNSRPTVQFKICISKKSVDTSNKHQDKGNAEAMSWFVNDEVKDDRKRRAEQILRESMEIGETTGSESVVN